MKTVLYVLGIVALLGCLVWWEGAVWTECLRDHTFMYCLRVLG